MSLLTVVQSAARRVGIAVPTSVAGSSDVQALQLMEFVTEEGQDLTDRYPWARLQTEATFVTVAAELQGALSTLAPSSFQYILNDTIWNRSKRRPIYGGLSPEEWQRFKASPVTGPLEQFRLRGGNLYFTPIPTAGETCAFEYMSGNWCESNLGVGHEVCVADTDVFRLPERLILLGVVWRWKRSKGLAYAEDFRLYETEVANAQGRDAGKPRLSLDGSPTDRLPGIVVPQGNWNL